MRKTQLTVVALVTLVITGVFMMPQQASAAQWPNESAMACDGGSLRRSFIYDPGVCNAIASHLWASDQFLNYFGTDRGHGRFDRNFLVWAPIIRAFNGNDLWTFCGSRNTPPHGFCPTNDIRTNLVSVAIGDGMVTAKRWGGQFIGVYCANYSPHAGTAAGPIPKIRGTKYLDVNRNGARDPGEPGLAGWTIELYFNGTRVLTTTTAANGTYEFPLNANLGSMWDGTYQVREQQQDGYIQTAAPPAFFIPLHVGDAVFGGRDFGNYRFKTLAGQATALLVVAEGAGSHSVSDTGPASVREDATPYELDEHVVSHEQLGLGSVHTLHAGVFMSGGEPVVVRSSASTWINELTIALPAGDLLEMRGVRSDSSSTCAASEGSVRISYLSIGGNQLSPGDAEPEPDTRIDLPGGGFLVLNSQSTPLDVDQGQIVMAARLIVPGAFDIIIGYAESAITNC